MKFLAHSVFTYLGLECNLECTLECINNNPNASYTELAEKLGIKKEDLSKSD